MSVEFNMERVQRETMRRYAEFFLWLLKKRKGELSQSQSSYALSAGLSLSKVKEYFQIFSDAGHIKIKDGHWKIGSKREAVKFMRTYYPQYAGKAD